MYVVEGSVMGAPHVTKMLASQVKLDDNTTSTFFDLPAHEIAASWNTFLSNFYRDFEEDERRSIIRGAETTFATFSNWIDQKAS